MRSSLSEKLTIIKRALESGNIVFVRVLGAREYAIEDLRIKSHTIEFTLAGGNQTLTVSQEEIGAVRINEKGST
jgi:hypothetical protein